MANPAYSGRKDAAGIVYALISAATFGLLPLFTLPLLHAGVSTSTALVYRFTLAVAIVGLILLLKRQHFSIGLAVFLKLGVLSSFYMLAVLFFFEAYNFLASSIVATLIFLYPLIVMLIMTCFFHDAFQWKTAFAAVLALIGVALLSGGTLVQVPDASNTIIGVSLSLLSALANAVYIVAIQRAKLPSINGLELTFYVMLYGALAVWLYGACNGSLQWLSGSRELALAILLALFTAVISNLTLILAIKRIGPTLTSILGVMEPVVAIMIGILVFNEPLNYSIGVGIVLVIAATIIVIIGKARG